MHRPAPCGGVPRSCRAGIGQARPPGGDRRLGARRLLVRTTRAAVGTRGDVPRPADRRMGRRATAMSSATPDITVVIPTRDRVSILGVALRSALSQQGVELEVVVVDDGST